MTQETRMGLGYDVHKFIPFEKGEECVIALGGLTVPHTYKFAAHSDGDVVLHALTDAILGAIGEGDIGLHFPPSDDAFANMGSAHFVQHACQLLTEKGGALVNTDITIIGERPKLTPHRMAMQASIATIVKSDISRINVKATTTEKLGFEGRCEGLAAQAIVAVTLPIK